MHLISPVFMADVRKLSCIPALEAYRSVTTLTFLTALRVAGGRLLPGQAIYSFRSSTVYYVYLHKVECVQWGTVHTRT